MICYGFVFFFSDTATTEIYTLSLHDALPISRSCVRQRTWVRRRRLARAGMPANGSCRSRSEEHTSELQSHSDLVCRLLLEKKKTSLSCSSRGHRGRIYAVERFERLESPGSPR